MQQTDLCWQLLMQWYYIYIDFSRSMHLLHWSWEFRFWLQLLYIYLKSTFEFVMHVQSISGTLRCLMKTKYFKSFIVLSIVKSRPGINTRRHKGIIMLSNDICYRSLFSSCSLFVDLKKTHHYTLRKNILSLIYFNWIFKKLNDTIDVVRSLS